MASNTVLCGLCDQQNIATPSTDWCPECEEALCSSCKKHHSLSKASRNHKTIPIENYQILPSSISSIKQYCEEHDDKYQMLCQKHDKPLCLICVKAHKACIDVVPLGEVIKYMKTEEIIENIRQSLSDLLDNLTTMKKDREANIANVDYQKQAILNEVRNLRCKINEHLDNLEEQMIKHVTDVSDQVTKDIQETLGVITEKETQVNHLQRTVDNIKSYASELQMFFGMRDIEFKVRENEESLKSLVDEKRLDRIEINGAINSKLKDILTTVQTYGTVDIKTNKSTIRIKSSKDKQAQQMMTTSNRSLTDMKVTLKQKINIGGETVRGCCVTEYFDLLFADHYFRKTLKVYSPAGEFKYDIKVENSSVYDVKYIGNNTVAVTSGKSSKNCVDIINLNTGKIRKTISLPGRVYGICHNENSLFCCVENRNIRVISLTDNTVTTINNTVLPEYSYVTTYGDKVLYSNQNEHAVSCSKLNGKLVWKFKDENILNCPSGITVDRSGNVYVAGENTRNVVVISPDGKNHRQILDKDDGLFDPMALYYNNSNNTLLVADYRNIAFIFHVS